MGCSVISFVINFLGITMRTPFNSDECLGLIVMPADINIDDEIDETADPLEVLIAREEAAAAESNN